MVLRNPSNSSAEQHKMASRVPSLPQCPEQLDIVVVGAGLAGLAAAISTRLAGHNVTVFESAKELLEVGAGLQITPNATRILQQWDLPESLWQSAAEPKALVVHRYSGQVLAIERSFDQTMRCQYQAPFLDLHRVDLQLSLVERAKALGIRFELGQRVESIDFDTTEITTKSGIKVKCDLIVAADGLWSKCRDQLPNSNSAPQATGDLAYRVVLDLEQVADPELRVWISNPAVHFWIGPGAHAVGYSLRAGKMYNIVLLVPDDLPTGVSRQAGSVEEMQSLFHSWDPILGKFLGMVDSVEKWKLMHIDELPEWVSPKSNVVFLGDSCHPMLPYLAQGANSAIEDGAVLGQLLGHMRSKLQLPKALRMYEKLRKSRGDAIVKETFRQREAFHMPDGPAQKARDEVFLSQLGEKITGPFPSRWTCPQVQPWLYGYDASKEVQKAVEKEPFQDPKNASVNGPKTLHSPSDLVPSRSKRSFGLLRALKRWLATWM